MTDYVIQDHRLIFSFVTDEGCRHDVSMPYDGGDPEEIISSHIEEKNRFEQWLQQLNQEQ